MRDCLFTYAQGGHQSIDHVVQIGIIGAEIDCRQDWRC
jgi:hypothetical protein